MAQAREDTGITIGVVVDDALRLGPLRDRINSNSTYVRGLPHRGLSYSRFHYTMGPAIPMEFHSYRAIILVACSVDQLFHMLLAVQDLGYQTIEAAIYGTTPEEDEMPDFMELLCRGRLFTMSDSGPGSYSRFLTTYMSWVSTTHFTKRMTPEWRQAYEDERRRREEARVAREAAKEHREQARQQAQVEAERRREAQNAERQVVQQENNNERVVDVCDRAARNERLNRSHQYHPSGRSRNYSSDRRVSNHSEPRPRLYQHLGIQPQQQQVMYNSCAINRAPSAGFKTPMLPEGRSHQYHPSTQSRNYSSNRRGSNHPEPRPRLYQPSDTKNFEFRMNHISRGGHHVKNTPVGKY